MVAGMPIRTGADCGSSAGAGVATTLIPSANKIAAVRPSIRMVSCLVSGWGQSRCGGTDRGRGGDDAGVEPAGRDPLHVGERKDLVVKGLVVRGLRLPRQDVGLEDVFLLDVGHVVSRSLGEQLTEP